MNASEQFVLQITMLIFVYPLVSICLSTAKIRNVHIQKKKTTSVIETCADPLRPTPIHSDLTPTSLRPHSDLTPTSLRPHSDLTPTSLRPHSDLTPTSLRPHSDLTPTSLRPHSDLTPTSLLPT